MIKIRKVLLVSIITSVMLCNTAFASEVSEEINNIDQRAITTEEQREILENGETEDEAEVKTGIVNVNVLNVRSGPTTEEDRLGKLSLGTSVEILSETDEWYEINYQSDTAYLYSEYVTIIDTENCTGSGLVEYAKAYIGTPYAHGGNSPSGFDCSGFVQYVMSNFGVSMPRSSTDQYSIGVRVDKSLLMPGDLVFFKYSASSYRLGHVGIYVGDGNFIHSPVPGQAVEITSLNNGFFSNYYYGATRVIY